MVYAKSEAGGEYWTMTDGFGNYTLSSLPAGTFTVNFDSSLKVVVKNVTAGQSRQRVDGRISLKAQLKGHVTGSDGQGPAIADVVVRVFSATNDSVPLAWTFTDSNGDYFVHGLPAGSVKVHFELDYVTSGSYLPSWNADKASFFTADSLALTATQLRTGINTSLARAGQISGQVRLADLPRYTGIWISLTDLASEWNTVSFATTDSQGQYVLRHVPTGRYRIKFVMNDSALDNIVSRWFSPMGPGDTFANAAVISVTGDQTVTGIDQTLETAGSIAGKVASPTGAGVGGVVVYAFAGDYEAISTATTDASGNYRLRGLAQGSYKLRFSTDAVTSGSYLSQWSQAKSSFESADVLTIGSAENLVGYNVALVKAAQISGVVKNSANAGVAGIGVYAMGPQGEWDPVAYAETGANGAYTLRGIPAGTYKIRFDTSSVTSASYDSTWSGAKTTYATAVGVAVTVGQVRTGINVTVPKAAQIAGTVTNIAGVGIPGVHVSLINPATGDGLPFMTSTDSAGKYVLRGVTAGVFKLSFSTESVTVGSYLSNWTSGATSLASATSVTVSAGATKTGINSTLQNAGSISSVVVAGDAPVSGALFEAYLASGDGSMSAGRAFTDSTGHLTIRGLAPGSYRLYIETSSVSDISIATGWMWGTSFADSVAVPVQSGQDSFVAITPDIVGSVNGRITANDLPVRGARVEVYLPSDVTTPIATALTDTSGSYIVRGIPLGTFKVRVAADHVSNGNYMSQWFGNTVGNLIGGDADHAVENAMPSATSVNLNIGLTAAAGITGNLTTVEGDVLAGVQVSLIDAADENNEVASVRTDVFGDYKLTGIAQGAYKLRFDPGGLSGANLRVTWFKEKPSFNLADTINVTWGQPLVLGTSEVLAGAQAMGKITTKTGGKPIAGVTVLMCPTMGTCSQSTTDASGNYVVSGLQAGSYRVQFDSTTSAGSYLPAFWANGTSWENATVVTFASRQVRTMNAQLVAGATISGRVTNSAGEGIDSVQVMTYSTTTESWLGASAFTDEQGYYTLKGVQAGGVKVKFDASQAPTSYDSKWSNDKYSFLLADVLNLTVGQTRTLVNASLVRP
jgi:protocatechuate 3,4-dioxygenase beta subunit